MEDTQSRGLSTSLAGPDGARAPLRASRAASDASAGDAARDARSVRQASLRLNVYRAEETAAASASAAALGANLMSYDALHCAARNAGLAAWDNVGQKLHRHPCRIGATCSQDKVKCVCGSVHSNLFLALKFRLQIRSRPV